VSVPACGIRPEWNFSAPAIDARIAEGFINIADLHRQLTERGFKGSYGSVYAFVTKRLGAAGKKRERLNAAAPPAPRPPSARQLSFEWVRRPEKRKPPEQARLDAIRGATHAAADQLFVTLDPAARLVSGGGRAPFVLTDTVGFIQKLPTQLVAAFKATLEELEDAQLLLHVVDASHPHAREHMSAVYRVLEELGLEDRPALTVMNKIDRLEEPNGLLRETLAEGGVAVSARTGEGFDALLTCIGEALRSTRSACRLCVPYERGGILSRVYARGRVLGREDRPDGIWLDVEVPRALEGLVRPYRVAGSNGAGARERATTWPVGRGTTLQEAGS
jgi:hypothetical protein